MPKAIIVVDHGSRREESNRILDDVREHVLHLLAERGDDQTSVHVAHMELAKPDLNEAVASALRSGANELTVVPFFIGPGRHATEDIPRMARAAVAKYPGVRLHVANPFGAHPLLAEIVLERVDSAADGDFR